MAIGCFGVRRLARVVGVLFIFAASIAAQANRLPKDDSSIVNDIAQALSADEMRMVATHLASTETRTQKMMRVVIITSPAGYGYGDDLKGFARDLFKAWDVDRKTAGNGAMIVIASVDREAAVVVGGAYPDEARELENDVADNIIAMPLKDGHIAMAVDFGADVLAGRLKSGDFASSGPSDRMLIGVVVAVVATFVLFAVTLIARSKLRQNRERMLGGLSGPDAEALMKMSTDAFQLPSTPSKSHFDRPVFDRPDSPTHGQKSSRIH